MSEIRTPDRMSGRAWATLLVLSLGFLIVTVEFVVLNVALSALQGALDASTGELQWVVSGYHLTLASLLLTAGAIADRVGRRRMLLIGHLVLAGSSMLAAALPWAGVLIGLRALMGVGAAMILTSSLAIIRNSFEKNQTAALSVWATVGGLGLPIGLLAGGGLLEHFYWGSIFLVIPVFGVAAFLLAMWRVEETVKPEEPRALDWPGLVLSTIALSALVWALIEGGERGWDSTQVRIAFVVAATTGLVWLLWEHLAKTPMVDLGWLRKRSFWAAALPLDMAYLGVFGLLFLLALHLQVVQGFDALETGVRMLPAAAGSLLGGALAHLLIKRLGIHGPVICAGATLVGIGFALLIFTPVEGGYPLLAVALVLAGLGLAATTAAAQDKILGTFEGELAGVGSGLGDTVKYVGGVLGVALLPSIAQSEYASDVAPAIVGLPAEAAGAVSDGVAGAARVARESGNPALADAAFSAFVNGLHTAALVGAVIVLLAALVPLAFLRRQKAKEAVPVPDTPLVYETVIDVAGTRVRVSQCYGDGPTAVLVPGWRRNARFWRHTIQWFAARGQRAVAFDFQPDPNRSLFDQWVKILGVVLDRYDRGDERFVLVGHSMGAAILGVYAAVREDPRVIGWCPIAAPGLEESKAAERDLRKARRVVKFPARFTQGNREAMAAAWSAEPDSDRFTAEDVVVQARLVLRYMGELGDRFTPDAITGRARWIFFAHDRLWSLNASRRIAPREHQLVQVLQCHHVWRPSETWMVAGAVLDFVRECAREAGSKTTLPIGAAVP